MYHDSGHCSQAPHSLTRPVRALCMCIYIYTYIYTCTYTIHTQWPSQQHTAQSYRASSRAVSYMMRRGSNCTASHTRVSSPNSRKNCRYECHTHPCPSTPSRSLSLSHIHFISLSHAHAYTLPYRQAKVQQEMRALGGYD